MTFSDTLIGTKEGEQKEIDIDDPSLKEELGEDYFLMVRLHPQIQSAKVPEMVATMTD